MSSVAYWYSIAAPYDRQVGAAWYPSARAECQALADEFGIELERVVYAVAALSPQLKWERNIAAARSVLLGKARIPGAYSANVEKAWHILNDATSDWRRWLRGNKVTSFAQAILGDAQAVCVDTWAWRVWAGADLWAAPPNLDKIYWDVVEDYRRAASQIGIAPRELQAVTWVAIRRVAYGRAAPGQMLLL